MKDYTILLKYYAAQHSISEDAAAELLLNSEDDKGLKDNALSLLIENDKKRVSSLKGKNEFDKTEIFNQAHAKAKKEERQKLEKAIGKKYGVENEGDLFEMIESVIGAKSTLKPDDVKAHPLFLALEREKLDEIQRISKEKDLELNTIKTGYARKDMLGKVRSKVLKTFEALNPILSKDAARSDNQKQSFASTFDNFEYQQDGDNILILQDGKRVEDAHGNPMQLENLVEKEAGKYYDFSTQSRKESPSNKTTTQTVAITNDDEYAVAILNATSEADRSAITASYKSD
tara:strand:+ start:12126 stop:12989 length:864 start_codon:yes stop_codon:yes gene_type:complete